jgi:hypothetical protein
MTIKTIELNDLPRYSPWIVRMLGLCDYQVGKKTPSEVLREYNVEKWGAILEKVAKSTSHFDIDLLDRMNTDKDVIVPFSMGEQLYIGERAQVEKMYYEILRDRVISFLNENCSITELGAGFGRILFKLASDEKVLCKKFSALEYTVSGVNLMRLIKDSVSNDIDIGFCDLNKMLLKGNINKKSVIFTSQATMYVPEFPLDFPELFRELNPRYVIHFEPFFELIEDHSVLSLLRKRYIMINDYNINLMSVLNAYEKKGDIVITKIEKNVFGENALLPLSMVVWKFI